MEALVQGLVNFLIPLKFVHFVVHQAQHAVQALGLQGTLKVSCAFAGRALGLGLGWVPSQGWTKSIHIFFSHALFALPGPLPARGAPRPGLGPYLAGSGRGALAAAAGPPRGARHRGRL